MIYLGSEGKGFIRAFNVFVVFFTNAQYSYKFYLFLFLCWAFFRILSSVDISKLILSNNFPRNTNRESNSLDLDPDLGPNSQIISCSNVLSSGFMTVTK